MIETQLYSLKNFFCSCLYIWDSCQRSSTRFDKAVQFLIFQDKMDLREQIQTQKSREGRTGDLRQSCK